MKKRVYIFAGVFSYLLFLISSIPAKPVIDLLNQNYPLTLQGTSGTLWTGKAYTVSLNNRIEFKNTEWSFNLWKILTGRIAIDIATEYSGNELSMEAGTTFTGSYFINDLQGEISAKDVAELADFPLAQLSGVFSLDIAHARWKQGELPVASGLINWNNAEVTVADSASLGNVKIQLGESEQQLLQAELGNQGGDISITGTAELVPEAGYDVNIKLTPTASANNSIKQSLAMFAKRQNNGAYLFTRTGQLSETGLM